MDFTSFQRKVTNLKALKPVWFGLDSDSPATEAEIEAAESALGVALPTAYKSFVREFGGGYFGFGNVFSVSESEWNIVRRNDEITIPGFIAISDNEAGDHYGFRVSGGACEDRVYVWDHEEPSEVKATDYEDMLELLDHVALKPS
jgi:hypothetical protein